MTSGDRGGRSSGQSGFDLVVVGGGIMGLWACYFAAARGLSVALVERDAPGRGASFGHVGALMPHSPEKWNPKKQFQLDALLSLEPHLAALEDATGLSAGFRRSGRLTPLPKPHLRRIAERQGTDALENWPDGCWSVIEESPFPGFPDALFAEHGLIFDRLSARLSPRRLTALLEARLLQMPQVTLMPRAAVVDVDPLAHSVMLADGRRLPYGRLLLAQGVDLFAFAEKLAGMTFSKPLGQGVKGQSALLKADLDPALPMLFFDGLYVIAHEDGRVAVGSTSEDRYDDPQTTDHRLDELIERARHIVPSLRDAPVIERWAGVRPKAIGRDPFVGPLADVPDVHCLGGGFKVSFGLAHRLAEWGIARLAGEVDPFALPASFAAAHHLALATGTD